MEDRTFPLNARVRNLLLNTSYHPKDEKTGRSARLAGNSPGTGYGAQSSGTPIAVIVLANYISESLAEQVKRYARLYAPDIGVGVMDFEGLRLFAGHGLESIEYREAEETEPYNLPIAVVHLSSFPT